MTIKTEKSNSPMKRKVFKKAKFTYNFQLYTLCLLPILWIIIFHYVPMFGASIAFKDYKFNKGILGSEWVGFKNFEFFFKSNDFLVITRNTIFLNFLFIVVTVIGAIALAVLLYNLRSRKATKIFQTIYITPNFVSWVMVAYVVYAILNPQYGIMNKILESFGLEGANWYAESKYWPAILTIVSLWKNVGMDSIIYYAALMGIDESMLEAAKVDGASSFKIATRIMIPSILPIISMLVILKIGGIFRADFGLFYQVTMNSALIYDVTDVVDTYLYRTMKESNNLSLSGAIGLLQSVIGCIMILITNKISKKVDPETGLF